ncbi:MAG: phage portal protein [Phycisphaeraceae bacterium]
MIERSTGGIGLAELERELTWHERGRRPRLERLWRYFRNPVVGAGADGRGRLAQEEGLPARLTGRSGVAGVAGAGVVRERVVENDIAWRVQTLVEFMFGKAVRVHSAAEPDARARQVEAFLHAVFEANGGVHFFQDMALLGSVYGFVDVLVRVVDEGDGAARIRLEVVEPVRAVPMLDGDDYRRLRAYAVHVRQRVREDAAGGWLSRVLGVGGGGRFVERTEVWTDEAVRWYRGERGAVAGGGRTARRLVGEEVNWLGRVPVVHIQNLPQPFHFEGLSDVEPLLPLQDELNTRLSDRANRVTFQSFKMYLGKGIEGFTERPVGPGQMWSTDNPDASIEAFGGDAATPSEDAHIQQIRAAMDKASGVTAVAAGLVEGQVGNLTSGAALRVVLMGLLAKTKKKRVTYGAGLKQLCELVLHAADVHGVFANEADERGVTVDWPDPLPDSEMERLRQARLKLEVGVGREQVLRELGY